MAIFRRQDIEDEDYEEEKLPPKKKFRDLYPANRKKRKAPPKPWGKLERIFVFLVLSITVIGSVYLAAISRSWKFPGLPKIALPRIPTFKSEPIVIEGDKRRDRDRERAENIIKKFNELTKNLSGIYALYVVDLETEFSFGINENEIMQAASLIKLPVITILYKEAEKGNINLETKYTLKNSDKVEGSGSLYGKKEGTVFTYRELAKYMAKESDNTAFNIIKRTLTDKKINDLMQEAGIKKTSLSKNETTAKDIGTLLEKLWQGKIVTKKSKDEILDYLTDTIYEDYIPKRIPDVRVAHKFGRELHVINDAGIIFASKPFILVIMSQGIIEKEADEAIPQIAKIVYDVESLR